MVRSGILTLSNFSTLKLEVENDGNCVFKSYPPPGGVYARSPHPALKPPPQSQSLQKNLMFNDALFISFPL